MVHENAGYAERPNRIPWPPIIYACALVGGWLIHLALPLPWVGGFAGEILFGLGFAFIAGGIAFDVAAMRELAKRKTTIMPNRKSDHLVSSGIYGFSRNPIYLGNTLLVVGAALVSGIIWYLPLAFVAAFATTHLAIRREEKHLEAHFGKLFRDYKKRVNRWF